MYLRTKLVNPKVIGVRSWKRIKYRINECFNYHAKTYVCVCIYIYMQLLYVLCNCLSLTKKKKKNKHVNSDRGEVVVWVDTDLNLMLAGWSADVTWPLNAWRAGRAVGSKSNHVRCDYGRLRRVLVGQLKAVLLPVSRASVCMSVVNLVNLLTFDDKFQKKKKKLGTIN